MYNGKIVEWPLGCNSHGDHLMGWKSRQDLSNRNIYLRGKHEPFLFKIDTYIVYMAYFYSTKYHILPCFVHGEIRRAIAGDQVMGMRQYKRVLKVFQVFSIARGSSALAVSTAFERVLREDRMLFTDGLPSGILDQHLFMSRQHLSVRCCT